MAINGSPPPDHTGRGVEKTPSIKPPFQRSLFQRHQFFKKPKPYLRQLRYTVPIDNDRHKT